MLYGIHNTYINMYTRIQKFEEDGSQRDGEAALQGRGSGIRRFVGQLCGERRDVCERWTASIDINSYPLSRTRLTGDVTTEQ